MWLAFGGSQDVTTTFGREWDRGGPSNSERRRLGQKVR